jgi:prevent-host-death family protein
MPADLPTLDQLPRQTSSHVKNKWRELVQEVRESGSVAITNHSAVEMVLVDARTYERLAESAAALKAREASVLDQLSAQFEQRLAVLQQADAGKRVDAVFASKGRMRKRPKAGGAY